jgi:hypothetical protein
MRISLTGAFISVMVFAACALPVACAQAQDLDNEHLCTAADLHGVFVMINLTETPEGAEASWYRQAPYHYLAFYPDKTYSSMAVGSPIDKLADLKNALKEKGGAEFKYKIGDQGVLELVNGKVTQYGYRCYAVTDNSNSNQKGDLILSGHGNGNPSNLVKLYRPVTKDMDVQ